MVREFSQTVAEEDAQPCQHSENCHSLVPGMTQYGESQDFSKVGNAVEGTGGESLSTSAAHIAELSQSLDRVQESTTNNKDFSPATK